MPGTSSPTPRPQSPLPGGGAASPPLLRAGQVILRGLAAPRASPSSLDGLRSAILRVRGERVVSVTHGRSPAQRPSRLTHPEAPRRARSGTAQITSMPFHRRCCVCCALASMSHVLISTIFASRSTSTALRMATPRGYSGTGGHSNYCCSLLLRPLPRTAPGGVAANVHRSPREWNAGCDVTYRESQD